MYMFNCKLHRTYTLQNIMINNNRYFLSKSSTITGHHDVIIAGGGIIGTSVGYHLSKHPSGIKPLLLEQASLTSGTTWHAASLLGTIRTTTLETSLTRYTNYYLREIEQETGFSPSFKHCTSITLASTPKRMQMLQRIAAVCHSKNINVDLITADAAKALCPYLNYSDVIGALHIAEDASCTASDVVQCYARGMQQNGGKILEKCRIISMEAINYGLNGFKIRTDNFGDFTCNYFVNCSGQWAKQLGQLCDVNIPLASCEHYYIISKPVGCGVDTMMPVVRDPDAKSGFIYFREWSGGILCGTFERNAKIAFGEFDNLVPDTFEFGLFDDDWQHFEANMDDILHRCPLFGSAEIQMVAGPESFTIDCKPLIGEVSELYNYYVAAGMNSGGITLSGGVGKLLSNWIIYNDPTYFDNEYKYKNAKLYEIEKQLFSEWPRSVDIKRFHPYSNNINVQINGAKQALGDYASIMGNMSEMRCVLNVRSSPCYHYQKYKQNAYFIADTNNGYSVAAFFGEYNGNNENVPDSIYSLGGYQHIIDGELETFYSGISIIFDRSMDTKCLLIGKDVNKFVSEIIKCADICERINGICSVIIKNKKSENIEFMADLWKLNEDKYLIQCQYYEFYSYLYKQRIVMDIDCNLIDVSSQFCIFHIVGNNALNDLISLSHSSSHGKLNNFKNGLNDGQFEWIEIGSFRVAIAGNVKNSQNYCCKTNEYQILISSDYSAHFYQFLCESQIVTIKPCGFFVWDILRIQNGIAKYNVDFDATYFKKIKQGSHELVKGKVTTDCSNNDNGLYIPFGGEPIVNASNQCFGYISSIRYRGNSFPKHFIANLDKKCLHEKKLKIRVGNNYIGCQVSTVV